MAEIVLSTLNAKYAHSAFGLRYLLANLGALQERAALCEFNISQRPIDIVESILAQDPRVVGLGVYIWNVAATTEVVQLLKKLRPELVVVLGGPEVSYETSSQAIVQAADYVIRGEGEVSFRQLCAAVLAGAPPSGKIFMGEQPDVTRLALPYSLYTDEDIGQRVIYVEASRGCPYRCEFCLSSLDDKVRRFPLAAFLQAMGELLARGARQFKFIDRTFNLHIATSRAILEFFWERYQPGLFLHFEMIPDRLPTELRQLIARFPAGAVQLEIGIQTLNPEVEERIARRQDHARLHDNLHFLRDATGVHIHADLIVGLPGETLDSFATGFDTLLALRPQEIQVGILKRLRGTPIVRHDSEWDMVYSPVPPYDVLRTGAIDFGTMQRLKRLARYWDMVCNSGHFRASAPLLWGGGRPFYSFLAFSDWLYAQVHKTGAIALDRLAELLVRYLVEVMGLSPDVVLDAVRSDYGRGASRRIPAFLQPTPARVAGRRKQHLPHRQALHLAPLPPAGAGDNHGSEL